MISVAIVLTAVFVPTDFVSGISGQFYRQFALTIAIATLISAFNSLTLSPALAALLIKPGHAKKDVLSRLIEISLGWFFRLFNRTFDLGISAYGGIVKRLLRVSALVLVIFGGLLVLTGVLFEKVPGGFIPNLNALQQATDAIVKPANTEPGLVGVFTTYRSQVPQLYLNIDRDKVQTLDVLLNSIFTTLQSYLGTN